MKKLLVAVLAVLSIGIAQAEHVNVFCSKEDGSDWYWLLNEYGNNQTLEGRWVNLRLENRSVRSGFGDPTFQGIFFDLRFFLVPEQTYLNINNQCGNGYYAQHSTNGSEWDRFAIQRQADAFVYIGQGHVSGVLTETPRLPDYAGVIRETMEDIPQSITNVINSSLFTRSYLRNWLAGNTAIGLGI